MRRPHTRQEREPHVPGFNPDNSHFDRGTPKGCPLSPPYQVTASNGLARWFADETGAVTGEARRGNLLVRVRGRVPTGCFPPTPRRYAARRGREASRLGALMSFSQRAQDRGRHSRVTTRPSTEGHSA
jgi:hypothetical protein